MADLEVIPPSSALQARRPTVLRDSKGRILKGSITNPKGRPKRLPSEQLSKLRALSKDLLEELDAEGKTLFERTVRVLLQPVIEQRREGEPFYLVNHQTILATIAFLTERADGRMPVPDAPAAAKGKTITVVIRAAMPAVRGVTGPRAVPPAASSSE